MKYGSEDKYETFDIMIYSILHIEVQVKLSITNFNILLSGLKSGLR